MPACLRSIIATMPPGGEVLVVDDGSTDGTARVAALYPVRMLKSGGRQGPAAARNLGARQAKGGVLVFLDADVEVAPGSIERLLTALETAPELDAVIGSYDDAPAHPQLVSQFRNLLHHFVHHQARRDATTFWTGCGAMRRETFDRAGGFDAGQMWLEDVEMGLRVSGQGGRILLDASIQVKHHKRWTLGSMIFTDVFGRAVPWMRLMRERDGLRNDLNTRWPDRLSAAAVCLAAALACLGRWEALGALALAVLFSRAWHSFLLERRGLFFALRALPLHWLFLFYSAATFAVMSLRWSRRG